MTSTTRVLCGIVGIPGSGKTGLSKRLVEDANAKSGKDICAHLPMDGFHFRNSYLHANGLYGVKGAIHTYDVGALLQKITEIKQTKGKLVRAPDYVRAIHDVVEEAVVIKAEADLVIVEGIYIGVPLGLWENVAKEMKTIMFLDETPKTCVERIIKRNLDVGRSRAEIIDKLINDLDIMKITLQAIESATALVRL